MTVTMRPSYQIPNRLERVYFSFCGGVLAISALMKLTSVMVHPELAGQRDVLFRFLSSREMMTIAACLELIVATMSLVKRTASREARLIALIWLGCAFLSYRVGPFLLYGSERVKCKCFGAFSFLPDSGYLDAFLLAVAFSMVSGGGLLLIRKPGGTATDVVA